MQNAALRTARLLAALAVPLAGSGCYAYSVVRPDALGPGEEVRARITAEEAERLQPQLPAATRVLEGRVVGTGSGSLMLEVPTATRTGRTGIEVLHQRVVVQPGGLIEVERRRLDRARTGGLIAAGALGVGYIVFSSLGGEPGSQLPPPGGGPADLRVPVVFSLRLPLP